MKTQIKTKQNNSKNLKYGVFRNNFQKSKFVCFFIQMDRLVSFKRVANVAHSYVTVVDGKMNSIKTVGLASPAHKHGHK